MENEQIHVRLTEVFRAVFRSPNLQVSDSLGAGDLDGWDSLNHVVLISAIEEKFGIKFKLRELLSIDNVGDLVRFIREKTSGVPRSELQ